MRGVTSHESRNQTITGEHVRPVPQLLHLGEELRGEVRLADVEVGADGGVEEGLGAAGDGGVGAEEEAVEAVVVIGGDEIDEEGFGIGEFVVGEERGEEGEEGARGLGEEGEVGVGPVEEGEECGGVGG